MRNFVFKAIITPYRKKLYILFILRLNFHNFQKKKMMLIILLATTLSSLVLTFFISILVLLAI
jgi:hypothetical protein